MKKLPKSKIDNLKGYFEEQIQDDGVGTVDERVAKIIKQTCWLCAVVAVFPLPVADIYFLSFLQFLMALRIGEIYGKKVDREEFIHILKSLGLTAVSKKMKRMPFSCATWVISPIFFADGSSSGEIPAIGIVFIVYRDPKYVKASCDTIIS